MIVPVVIGTALFMQFLDTTAIAVVLPDIARSLDVDPASLSLAITVYFAAVAIFIPASGWVADRYGARTIFQLAVAAFTLASIACGLSNSLGELIVARSVQGIAAGLMMPVARLILLHSFPRSQLVRVTTWFSFPALVGPMLGASVGGFLATYVSWHWVFFINLPFGVIAIVMTGLMVKNYKAAEPRPFDWKGFLLLAAAIGCAIAAMEAVTGGDQSGILTAAGLVTGAILIGAMAWLHARRHPHPLLDLTLQRLATFRISNGAGFLYRVAFSGTLVLLPLLIQVGFGMTAAQAGIFTLCGAIGLFAIRPRVGYILRQLGFRMTLFWNGLLSAVSIAIFCVFTSTTPLVVIGAGFLFCGLCRSLQFMSLSTAVFSDVPPAQSSGATSFASTAEQLAAAFGTSVAGILLQLASYWRDPRAGSTGAVDIQIALATMAVLAAVSAFMALKLHADAGMEVSGKPSTRRNDSDGSA